MKITIAFFKREPLTLDNVQTISLVGPHTMVTSVFGNDPVTHKDVIDLQVERFQFPPAAPLVVDPLRAALEAIVNVEADSSSEPDTMGDALIYIDAVARAALKGEPLPPEPSDKHQCDNCGAEWREDELALAGRLSERVDPGGPMPSGECRQCGALCYPVE